ncbi:MAG TPA: hypothetical protein VGJ73_14665 [Verrucomicrobiae bacterium]|jgi:hypothetical protein
MILSSPNSDRRLIAKDAPRLSLFFLFLLIFGVSHSVNAAVVNANSDSLSDVQSAVNQANPGDTVNVPAGTATWTGTLTVNNDIQIIGAGVGRSTLVDNVPRGNGTLISWNTVSNGFCRLSGFSFNYLNTSVAYGGTVGIGGYSHAVRVDHCSFTNLYNCEIQIDGWVYGCIDHCVFYNQNNSGFPIEQYMDQYGGANNNYGDGSWAAPDSWGTTNALYIENCVFVGDNDVGSTAYDGYRGCRVVFRYNSCTNIIFGTHGTETGGRFRSIRSFEIYNNYFAWLSNSPSSYLCPWMVYIRGGSGVVYSNTAYGGIYYPIVMADYRSYSGTWAPWGGITGINGWDSNNPAILASGTASGTFNSSYITDTSKNWTANGFVNDVIYNTGTQLASYITGNTANTISFEPGYDNVVSDPPNLVFSSGQTYQVYQVYQALDQPGTGAGDLIADTSPGNGIPYDTVTGGTHWPREAVDPIYQWGNTVTMIFPDNPNGTYGVSDTPTIVQNYDWFDYTPKPGYTPLVYPHPLESTNSSGSSTTFSLTVVSGAGGGSYNSNSVVSISANASSNQVFAYWRGADIANTNQASTTVTMPASNLTVTAYYAPYPPATLQAAPSL